MTEQLFNDNWHFWKPGDSFAIGNGIPAFAQSVTLPHDALLEELPQKNSPGGNPYGFRDIGIVKYARTLFVPESVSNESAVSGGSLRHLALELRDASGTLDMSREECLLVRADGAEWFTVGSADPKAVRMPEDTAAVTFGGRLQLIMKKRSETPVRVAVMRDSDSAVTEFTL